MPERGRLANRSVLNARGRHDLMWQKVPKRFDPESSVKITSVNAKTVMIPDMQRYWIYDHAQEVGVSDTYTHLYPGLRKALVQRSSYYNQRGSPMPAL